MLISVYFCGRCCDVCCPFPWWCNARSLKNVVNTKVNLLTTGKHEATRWFPSVTSPLVSKLRRSPTARHNFVYVHFCSTCTFSECGLLKTEKLIGLLTDRKERALWGGGDKSATKLQAAGPAEQSASQSRSSIIFSFTLQFPF